MSASPSAANSPQRTRVKYVRAVGPRLRILLYVVLALVALLGANSIYLVSVTALEWGTKRSFQDFFYQYMFLLHLALGLLLIVPFILFGVIHLVASRKRKNKRAIRIGYTLFGASILLLVSGLALMRLGGFDLKQPQARQAIYWLHVICPLVAVWLYWLHRLAGPRIKWRVGLAYAGVVAVIVGAMVVLQAQDPRKWHAQRSKEGERYFEPSLARTTKADFIPAQTLMMDDYCKKCHQDVYQGWFHSAHHIRSSNLPLKNGTGS